MLVITAIDRRQPQEAAVELVGLGHQVVALAQARAGAEEAQPAADDHGRIEPGVGQQGADERGGGGLAVRAGDARCRSFSRISSPSISARRTTVMPRRRASRTSGLSSATAEEMTTSSTPSRWSGECPCVDLRAAARPAAGRLAARQVAAAHFEVVLERGSRRCRSCRRRRCRRSGCARGR